MILTNIDDVLVPFDPLWRDLAISLSGGADSALLAFLICDMIKSTDSEHINVHIISHTRCWKEKPWQQYDSLKVYNWLANYFTKIKFTRHTNFIAPDLEYGNTGPNIKDEYGKMVSGDNAQIRSYAEYICYQNNIDAYYNAVTKNPGDVDFRGMSERDINRTDDNHHLEIMQHMGVWALHPFRFVEKDWVLRQYHRLDIKELFDITRSCEGQITDLDYKNYKPYQYVPICGSCFWCKEREWAIERNQ